MHLVTVTAEVSATASPPSSERAFGIPGVGWKAATLALFAIWVVIVGAAHEPWFDEAQAWLIARDSSLYDLFAQRVRYEGTPGLWHLTLWIAIRLGLPYAQFYLISAFFAIAGAAVVLWRAPFPPWMRVGILFSYFFAYQYSVLARSYSADLFVVPLLAACFASRADNPIRYALALGALANLNAHGFMVAAALGVEFAWHLFKHGKFNLRKSWSALAIAAALGLFALLCAWQPADNNYIRSARRFPFFSVVVGLIRHGFIDRILVFSGQPPTGADALLGFALSVAAVAPSVIFIASRPARAANAGAIAALLLFSALEYASPWHSGLLYLLWIFGLWTSWPPQSSELRRQVMTGFAIIAAAQIAEGAMSGVRDFEYTISPGANVAEFLHGYRKLHPDARVAAFGYKTFAVQPYSAQNQFANYKGGAPGISFIDWRRGESWDPFAGAAGWDKLLRSRPDVIVASLTLLNGRINALTPSACRAGYVATRRYDGELLWRGAYYEDDTLVIFQPGSCQANSRPANQFHSVQRH